MTPPEAEKTKAPFLEWVEHGEDIKKGLLSSESFTSLAADVQSTVLNHLESAITTLKAKGEELAKLQSTIARLEDEIRGTADEFTKPDSLAALLKARLTPGGWEERTKRITDDRKRLSELGDQLLSALRSRNDALQKMGESSVAIAAVLKQYLPAQ